MRIALEFNRQLVQSFGVIQIFETPGRKLQFDNVKQIPTSGILTSLVDTGTYIRNRSQGITNLKCIECIAQITTRPGRLLAESEYDEGYHFRWATDDKPQHLTKDEPMSDQGGSLF